MPIEITGAAPERIQSLQRDLKAVVDDFQVKHDIDLSVDVSISGNWYQDVPKLALACADIQQVLKVHFANADFTPDDLRTSQEAVRQMDEFLAYIEKAMEALRKIHLHMRKQLCDRTQSIVDQVDALQRMPFLPKEQKSEIERYSAPIDKILAARQANRQAKRTGNERVKTLAAEQTAETQSRLSVVEQENAVLRGGTLSAPSTPKPAKKRRTRSR